MIEPRNNSGARTSLNDLTPFPIWVVLLCIAIGMCFIVLALIALYFKMSIWIPILCAIVAVKAIGTPWIYGYFLKRIKNPK